MPTYTVLRTKSITESATFNANDAEGAQVTAEMWGDKMDWTALDEGAPEYEVTEVARGRPDDGGEAVPPASA